MNDDIEPTSSDIAFEVFLATITEQDLNPFEQALYRHHRYEALKAS